MKKRDVTRRDFLSASATVVGGLSVVRSTAALSGQSALDARIRWGVVGVGKRARAHIQAFNELPFCEVTALCDIREEALRDGLQLVKGSRPKTFPHYRDLVEQPDVDAVCIVTPNHLHKQMTMDSLLAKKHVLCEKPMGITMEECDEVAEMATTSDRVLQYGMQLRHTPSYAKVNELVQSGVIGNISYAWISDFRQDIRELYDDPVTERTKNWRYFQRLTGGMLLEYSIHRLDLLNWWMNAKPTMVAAFGGHNVWRDRETIDHCGMLLEYANGAKATYGMTLYARGYAAPWILMGDAGQILIERGGRVVVQRGDVSGSLDSPRFPDADEVVEAPQENNGTKLQYVHFQKAVRGDAEPYPDWKIAYDAMLVGIQGEAAIQQRKVITL